MYRFRGYGWRIFFHIRKGYSMPAYWKLLSQIGSWRCDWSIDMTAYIALATSSVFDIISRLAITSWEVIHIGSYCPVSKHSQITSWSDFGIECNSTSKDQSAAHDIHSIIALKELISELTMFWNRTVGINVKAKTSLSWWTRQVGHDVNSSWCSNGNMWSHVNPSTISPWNNT